MGLESRNTEIKKAVSELIAFCLYLLVRIVW